MPVIVSINSRWLDNADGRDASPKSYLRWSSCLCISARSRTFIRGFINMSARRGALSERFIVHVGIGRHGMRVSRGLTSVTDERQRGSRSDTPFKDDERRDATRRDVPAPGRIFCRESRGELHLYRFA